MQKREHVTTRAMTLMISRGMGMDTIVTLILIKYFKPSSVKEVVAHNTLHLADKGACQEDFLSNLVKLVLRFVYNIGLSCFPSSETGAGRCR